MGAPVRSTAAGTVVAWTCVNSRTSSTVAWLAEEFGELAQAVRKGTPAQVAHEFSDVLAWLATLANQVDVDLTEVVDRYRDGCPKCSAIPCSC